MPATTRGLVRWTRCSSSSGSSSKANARVKTLSGGQQRRLDLGLGIIGNPELLVLDEPTTGFDPTARRGAWDLVRSMTGGGTTVILTTHYMDEAEALADRVAVINAGRIIAEGPPESLGGRDVGDVTIRFRLPPTTTATDLPVPATVADSGAIEIRTTKEIEVLATLTNWALREEIDLIGLTVERLTLEDVYLRLTGYGSDAEAAPVGDRAHERGHRRTGRSSGPRRPAPGGAPGPLRAVGVLAQPGGGGVHHRFSVVFLVLLAATAGNSRIAFLGNIRAVSYYVPSFAAYGVMSACFNMLTISIVVRREMGLLKRVRLSPLPTWVMLAAIFINALIISIVQVVIVVLIGRFAYHVAFPHNMAALVVAVVVGAICFTSLGIAISTLHPQPGGGGAGGEHHLLHLAVPGRALLPDQEQLRPGAVLEVLPGAAHDHRHRGALPGRQEQCGVVVGRHPGHGLSGPWGAWSSPSGVGAGRPAGAIPVGSGPPPSPSGDESRGAEPGRCAGAAAAQARTRRRKLRRPMRRKRVQNPMSTG